MIKPNISKETLMFVVMLCITIIFVKSKELQWAILVVSYWLSVIAEYLREIYNKKP